MVGSGSGGDKMFGRFTEQAHRVLDLAREEAERAGHRHVGPEHVLIGLVAESHNGAARVPTDMGRGSRRHRQITTHVGLPDGYQGAAGLLLGVLEVDPDQLHDVVATEVGGVQR